MSSVVISGDTSGAITLSAPAVAGTNTITLPASTGTVLTTTSPKVGNVLQVVQSSALGNTGYNSPTYVDSGLSVSITPSSTSSKILVLANLTGVTTNAAGTFTGTFAISDASNNNIAVIYDAYVPIYTSTTVGFQYTAGFILHSPATTSSFTYKLRVKSSGAIQVTNYVGNPIQGCNITLMEIAG